MLFRSHRPRRGTSLVEGAIAYPVVLLLTIGLSVAGLGVFRYLQVAAAAREGARWASVHGELYALETNHTLTAPSDIYSNAIFPHATGLDTSGMNFTSSGGQGTHLSFTVSYVDDTQKPTYLDLASGQKKTNIVTVTVTYSWVPEGYGTLLGTTLTLSSTSRMPISY